MPSNTDCSKEVKGYHSDHVTLSNDHQKEMRDRRNNGRTRLKNGLKKAEHPLPSEFSSQGSYAMRTMVQDDDCDYDIDDGVYFEIEDLKNDDGTYLSAPDTRQRIRDALKDDRLTYDATVKTNCVRQKYPSGYHIDIPVYRIRKTKDAQGNSKIKYEHASGENWVKSDARKVTRWYNDAVGSELKPGESDTSQLRRLTKLTKKMARSRSSWKDKTTSGICISKLVVDHFVKVEDRDDEALRKTWKSIQAKLKSSLKISHPVYADKNLAEADDEGVSFFQDCLDKSLDKLNVLDENDCTREDALVAWDNVFNTGYFSKQKDKEKSESRSLLRPAATATAGLGFPDKPVKPNKSSGFA